jgi:hypothetical protein
MIRASVLDPNEGNISCVRIFIVLILTQCQSSFNSNVLHYYRPVWVTSTWNAAMCDQAVHSENQNLYIEITSEICGWSLMLTQNCKIHNVLYAHCFTYHTRVCARASVCGWVCHSWWPLKSPIFPSTHFQNMTRSFLVSNMTGNIIPSLCVCIMLVYEMK